MSASEVTETALLAPSEDVRVERWLVSQFVRLGADGDDAVLLVADGVDYHEVEALIDRGCDLELALEILR